MKYFSDELIQKTDYRRKTTTPEGIKAMELFINKKFPEAYVEFLLLFGGDADFIFALLLEFFYREGYKAAHHRFKFGLDHVAPQHLLLFI